MCKEKPYYQGIYKHYEQCLARFGATHKGMDWPDAKEAELRYNKMLSVMGKSDKGKPSLLDLGCGAGLMVDYLEATGLINNISYYGIDISPAMVQKAKELHPAYNFECRDIITDPLPGPRFDYIIMNGILTEKLSLKYTEMEKFAKSIILSAFNSCKVGIAFNVMNSHVDWCRMDLFHWPFDRVAEFVIFNLSRHVVFTMDYGLFEYTTYVYKEPNYD